jgi:hypothetical protein
VAITEVSKASGTRIDGPATLPLGAQDASAIALTIHAVRARIGPFHDTIIPQRTFPKGEVNPSHANRKGGKNTLREDNDPVVAKGATD